MKPGYDMFQTLIRSKVFLGAVGAVLVIGGGSIYFSTKSKTTAPPVQVKRGTIIQEVVATGKTKPAHEVSLAFELGGRVNQAGVRIGDKVFSGQILAGLDASVLSAELLQNQALAESEQAKLDKIKRGTRSEEIKIQESKVANAEQTLSDAKKSLADAIQDAFTRSDDAVRNKADQFISNGRTINPQINFQVSDPALELSIKQGRIALESMLTNWQAKSDISSATAGANLRQVRSFLDTVSLALSVLGPNPALTQTTINGWKGDVSLARTSINTAITNLTSADESRSSAESNYTIEKNQLALDRAGATPEEIAGEEALLRQAQAKVAATEAELAKTAIRSPLNGIVTRQDAKVGEIVAPNALLISVVSESSFEIEANVPEIEIGKLNIGNPVSVTLDAFPGEPFTGKIVHIDPAETVVDGVVNFKVTIVFDKPDPRMKSGLTANLAIEALKKSNVLLLPQIAISEDANGTFATKFENKKEVHIPVVLGIQGQDGNVEIVSGLSEGETVLNVGAK